MNIHAIDIKRKLYLAFLKQKKTILVNQNYTLSGINALIENVLDEHPDVFYIKEWKCVFFKSCIQVYPKYTYTKQEIKKIANDCQKQKDKILSKIKTGSTYDQIKQLHDILVKNVNYKRVDNKDLHTIVGPLLYKETVCDGYSKTFKYILDELGVPCIIITGKGFNNSLNDSEEHAWNMVSIDGCWFHVDITYDVALSNKNFIRYDYFLISDKAIRKDHYFYADKVPIAQKDELNPYAGRELYITSKKSLMKYTVECMNKNQTNFVIKLPESILNNKIDTLVLNTVIETLNKMNISANVFILSNYSRKIVGIRIERMK